MQILYSRVRLLLAVSASLTTDFSSAAPAASRLEAPENLRKLDSKNIRLIAPGGKGSILSTVGGEGKIAMRGVEVSGAGLERIERSGLPISVSRVAEERTFEIGSASIKAFAAQLEAQRGASPSTPVVSSFVQLESTFSKYQNAYRNTLQSDNEANRLVLLAAAQEMKQELATVIVEAAGSQDPAKKQVVGKSFKLSLVLDAESRAISGPLSRYALSRYTDVVTNGSLVGRIDSGGSTIGSCVLIGDKVVITAGHVLTGLGASEYSISFSAGDKFHQYTRDRILVTEPGVEVAGVPAVLDLVIMTIKPKDAGADVVKDHTPASLYSGELALDESVYLLGFPKLTIGGPSSLVVNDACFAIYPHRIAEKNAKALIFRAAKQRIIDELQLLTLDEPDRGIKPEEIAERITEQQGFFQALYPVDGNTNNRRYVRAALEDYPQRVPVFGMDADSSGGDSGGGVFSKTKGGNVMVGLFVSGVRGRDTVYTAQLLRHEHAIPTSEIVRHLKAKHAALLTTYKVKIVSPTDL